MKTMMSILLTAIVAFGAAVTNIQHFDAVRVVPPAKSKQIECKTRADLNEGLVRNYDCDVADIQVLNADKMWIGTLGAIQAHDARKYQEFDEDRYRYSGKHIDVVYYEPTADASDDNKHLVICPRGMVVAYEGIAFTCVKAYQCQPDEYATDSVTCATLPDNAQRTATIGYTCVPGAKKDIDGNCVVPPANAHWTKDGTYKCDGNLIEIDGQCVEQAMCTDEQKYDADNNTCVNLPNNAHWDDRTTSSVSWSCNDAYVLMNGLCERKALCTADQRYNATLNTCITLPNHAHWHAWISDTWECDEKYVLSGPDITSPMAEYCKLAPFCEIAGSRWNAYSHECMIPPTNAVWSTESSLEWDCIPGFINQTGVCVAKAKCKEPDQRYNSYTNSCNDLPEHAHWNHSTALTWSCDDGYLDRGDRCEKEESCWFGNRLDKTTNTCATKPAHSHWRDTWSTIWECDAGYDQYSDECTKPPFSLDDHVQYGARLSFGAGLGDAMTSEPKTELVANLTIGTELYMGNLNNNVLVSLMPSFGYLLFDSEVMTAHTAQLELGTRVSLGAPNFHVYAMPFGVYNIGGKVSTHTSQYTHTKRSATETRDYTYGIEAGISPFTENRSRLDMYARFERMFIREAYITTSDILVLVGIRWVY